MTVARTPQRTRMQSLRPRFCYILVCLFIVRANPSLCPGANPSVLPGPRFHSLAHTFPLSLRGGQQSTGSNDDILENESDDGDDDEILVDEEAGEQTIDAELILPQLKGLGIDIKIDKDTPPKDVASQIHSKVSIIPYISCCWQLEHHKINNRGIGRKFAHATSPAIES